MSDEREQLSQLLPKNNCHASVTQFLQSLEPRIETVAAFAYVATSAREAVEQILPEIPGFPEMNSAQKIPFRASFLAAWSEANAMHTAAITKSDKGKGPNEDPGEEDDTEPIKQSERQAMVQKFQETYACNIALELQPSSVLIARVLKDAKRGVATYIPLEKAHSVVFETADTPKIKLGGGLMITNERDNKKINPCASELTYLFHLRILLNAYLLAQATMDTQWVDLDAVNAHYNTIEKLLRQSSVLSGIATAQVANCDRDMRIEWQNLTQGGDGITLTDAITQSITRHRGSFPTAAQMRQQFAGKQTQSMKKGKKGKPRSPYAGPSSGKWSHKVADEEGHDGVCRHYQKWGKCKYGNKCAYKHDQESSSKDKQ